VDWPYHADVPTEALPRQGVAAALQVEPADDVEAHERAPDILLGMPVGEGRDEHALGAGHAVAKQRQHVGCCPRDRGVEVGGGPKPGGWHAGHDGGPAPARQGHPLEDASPGKTPPPRDSPRAKGDRTDAPVEQCSPAGGKS
jgi:hypothetical protein